MLPSPPPSEPCMIVFHHTVQVFQTQRYTRCIIATFKRAHGGVLGTLTGRAYPKVKVWFIDRYP